MFSLSRAGVGNVNRSTVPLFLENKKSWKKKGSQQMFLCSAERRPVVVSTLSLRRAETCGHESRCFRGTAQHRATRHTNQNPKSALVPGELVCERVCVCVCVCVCVRFYFSLVRAGWCVTFHTGTHTITTCCLFIHQTSSYKYKYIYILLLSYGRRELRG